MAYVVTEPCNGCRDTSCVEVCPVDCFHEDENMVLIDPEECIDCAACVEECPVHAIYEEFDVPDKYAKWIQINAEKAPKLPVVNEKKPRLGPCEPPEE